MGIRPVSVQIVFARRVEKAPLSGLVSAQLKIRAAHARRIGAALVYAVCIETPPTTSYLILLNELLLVESTIDIDSAVRL